VPAASAGSAAGARALAAADLIVTTSVRTLAYACEHHTTAVRLLHFAHLLPDWLTGSEAFVGHVDRISLLAAPASCDPDRFAAELGLPAARICVHDDFAVPSETLPATGAARVVVAAGHLNHSSGLLALLDGFAMALPDLPGWQLRLFAAGRLAGALGERIAELGIGDRVAWFRQGGNLAAAHASAGVAARLSSEEAAGLPVLDALTSGLPVLGSVGVPAVRRFVEDGRNGVVLHRTDPESIAAALVRFGHDRFRRTCAHEAAQLPGGQLDADGSARLHRMLATVLDSDPAA
jgi:glycosyltransferase involved in cell wall biosynthesis